MKPDIVFYQQYALPYFGILSLTAHLKHAGLKSDVVIKSLEKNPIRTIKRLNPSIVGISVLSTEHNWLIHATQAVRSAMPHVKIIVGGIHAIFYPEEILSTTSADLVCHSEGEDVLLNVIKELNKSNPSWYSIPGISYRDSLGVIHTNERATLVQFDDKIVEDRAIYYDRYPPLANDIVHRFFSSRGCPYRCSFCYNSSIQDLFVGKGTYVRQKSVEHFIQEIDSQYTKYSIRSVFFYDDLFTFDKKWLKRFLEIYKIKINIPFMCTTRADLIDEDTSRMLAEAGCRTASFGIETGNYQIRKNILKKDISDEQIIRCGNLLRKYSIWTQTSNMFCLPNETLEDAYKTVELNIKAKANFAFSALFMPFPKTEIADYCIKQGFLRPDYSLKDLPHSFLTASILDMPNKLAIINIHRLIYFFVRWPLFFRISRKIVRFYFLNIFFNLVFLINNLLRYKEERGITLPSAIRYALRLRNSF